MHITALKATNMEMTDAIRSYVEEKFLSLAKLTTHFGEMNKCDIEVGRITEHHNKGMVYKAEVTMELPGEVIRIEKVDENLYAAIDAAKDELKEQLTKRSSKWRRQERKGQQIWKKLRSMMGRSRGE